MQSEILTRRNLPHWYIPGATQFVTFRLAGTLPQEVLDALRARKERLLFQQPVEVALPTHRERVHKLLFAEYDRYLDRNRDVCWLADPRIASLVRRNLYHWHGKKYGLLAYCIMPNHVHVLLLPFGVEQSLLQARLSVEIGETGDGASPLAGVMHSLKSYTAHEANKILGRKGAFWQHESYDHWVRDEDELERIVGYINANPVEAKLASQAHDFFWNSAHDRFLTDGDPSGWLALDADRGEPSLVPS